MKKTFTATLNEDASFEVPFDVRALYGEARPAVKMTILGETFRTRVMVYGGKYLLGLWKAVREEHALVAGQKLKVSIEPDRTPRTVAPPKELAAAMKKSPAARAGWKAMSFTHQREWAEAIAEAKRPETREKRVAQAIAALVEKSSKKKAKRSARPRP
jgi:hypothetical protein